MIPEKYPNGSTLATRDRLILMDAITRGANRDWIDYRRADAMDRLGVNKATVYRALRALSEGGLLEVKTGTGDRPTRVRVPQA